ncbi:MAG TPA: 3-isopropylmalate dehydratase small subunit [Acetobacteraceae bacterium]|jgi:3-isopropylmalate/(R)-2-methylmalate dehydratase small subunit
MTPFQTETGTVLTIDRANIDTDQIIPARFLRKPRSAGYQNFLFHDLRANEPAFPLNAPGADRCTVLLAGENFGCGSSREGAVYALVDAGFRCVIAPSFGDIFASNAGKNGLLTITRPEADMARLRHLPQDPTITIDLPAQTLILADGTTVSFAVDAFRKRCLLEGLDDIGLTLEYSDDIAAWQDQDRLHRPWAMPG